MSRFVRVQTQLRDRAALLEGLTALGLETIVADPRAPVMLEGSLECAGEPVELRLPAGPLETVEDFGFTRDARGVFQLVCGEYDRARLERDLLPTLAQHVAAAQARRLAAERGLELSETRDVDGTRRLKLRRR